MSDKYSSELSEILDVISWPDVIGDDGLQPGYKIKEWVEKELSALLRRVEVEAIQGASEKPQLGEQRSVSKSLTEVMASLELPWPEDVFSKVSDNDWSDIDDWLRENKGYAIDRVSGHLMRRGWKVYERLLRERVNDLVEDGFVVTTDVANPPSRELEAEL